MTIGTRRLMPLCVAVALAFAGAPAIGATEEARTERLPAPSRSQTPESESISLTLERSVAIAIANATSVLETQNQYELSGAQVLRSYGQFLPSLSLGSSYSYQTGSVLYTIQGATIVNQSQQAATFTLFSALNLFNGLADYSGLKAALERHASADHSLEWAKERVALDITQTYLQVILDEELLDIARKNLAASQERLRLLRGQTQVGSASIPDMYRQEAETSADSFAVSSNESRLRDDEILLIRKLRIDPEKSYRFETPLLAPRSSPLASRPLPELLQNALQLRNDVQSNRHLVNATDWDITQARSGYLPRIDLVFGRSGQGDFVNHQYVNGVLAPGFTQQGLGAQLGNQVEYSYTLQLTWNLFDRFATRLDVEQASATHENTKIALEDSRLQTQADVRTAYTSYGIALKQLDTARIGLASAEKSYEAVQGQYEVGSSSIVDVLTAQAALVQARSNQAQATINLKLQEKTLDYAVGKILKDQ